MGVGWVVKTVNELICWVVMYVTQLQVLVSSKHGYEWVVDLYVPQNFIGSSRCLPQHITKKVKPLISWHVRAICREQ